jgi:hypothetical protein
MKKIELCLNVRLWAEFFGILRDDGCEKLMRNVSSVGAA